MSKTIAYIRTSTKKQDLDNQRLEILEYARKHKLNVDRFVEAEVSSRKTKKQRRIDELMALLGEADTLIVSELSRLGRSTAEVIDLVNAMIDRDIHIIVIKQNLDMKKHDMQSKIVVTLFSLFAELERDLISMRTKEALATKKSKGIKLGKRKGIIQASKFDKDIDKIGELLGYGLSIRKIAKVLDYSSPHGLYHYVKRKKLRALK